MSVILIDGNNVAMAAYAANDTLTDMRGQPTGALYGMIRMLRPMLERTHAVYAEPNKLLIAWDSKPSWRHEFFPEYKASRSGERDEKTEQFFQKYVDQLPRLRQLLTILGIGQVQIPYFEADDVAGWYTRYQPETNWVLMSNDKDWLQLVRKNVWVWQPKHQMFVTPENFAEQTGCTDTEMFVKVKAIAGDKGDDVPGCKGVGDKTAIKYLTGEMKPTAAAKAKIDAWLTDPDGYARSLKLVDLRSVDLVEGVDMSKARIVPGKFDYRGFYETCQEFSFESILTEFNDWVDPFQKAA